MGFRSGALTDQEKKTIEDMVQYSTFSEIAKTLNRKATTIRKFCQRHGLTKDQISVKKYARNVILQNKHFAELRNQLTDQELDLAYNTYEEMIRQFAGDVLYTEECQIIDYAVISCLLNRALAREKFLIHKIEEQQNLREELEANKKDDDDTWYDKAESLDIRIASLADELKTVKKSQLDLIDRKSKAAEGLHGSRTQRASELTKINEKFSDLVIYSVKNPQWRVNVGLELAKMKLGIKEEYVRLGQLHQYADGVVDLPVLNSDTVMNIEDESGGEDDEE